MNDIDRNVMFWQQDGAPSHTSNATMQYLRGQFPGRVISKRGDWPWPPRSPDLTVCDFFLWGYLKQRIWNVPHDEQPNNLRQLREAIVTECRNIDQQTIQRSFDCRSHEQHVASMQEGMLLKMNRRSILENERVVLRCCLHYYI